MNILSLNTWGGRAGKKQLLQFLIEQFETVDVFCLQEVWAAPYAHLEGVQAGGRELRSDDIMVYGVREIQEALPQFEYFFHPHHGDNYGLMMLVRRGIEVIGSGDMFVHKYHGYEPDGDIGGHARNIQYVQMVNNGNRLTVINFHGLWNGKGKLDSEDRIVQSEKCVEFIQSLETDIVFCGDFNLLPETESLKIIERTGLRNLIKEYGITSTRTSYYTKPEKFADYAFVSPALLVPDFRVLPDEVSDHAPLLFNIVS